LTDLTFPQDEILKRAVKEQKGQKNWKKISENFEVIINTFIFLNSPSPVISSSSPL